MKKMKITTYVLFLVMLTLNACKDNEPHSPLLIKNRSSKAIFVYLTLSQPYYPDTSITNDSSLLREIIPSSSTTYFSGRVDWEGVYSEAPNGILSVFYFSLDTINYYPWDTIKEQYKVLRRDDFSLDDLMDRDFSLSYP